MYELKIITSYDASRTPYLAMCYIKQSAFDNHKRFPVACQNILENSYMDDPLTQCGHVILRVKATE